MKKSLGEMIFDTFNTVVLLLVLFITLYPMIYVLNASLSDPLKLLKSNSFFLWPQGFQLEAYKRVFENPMIVVGYKNTLIYVVLGTVINILLTAMGAYALSRKDLYGKSFLLKLIIFTMFFSGGMIPSYLLVQYLGIMNTVWAILLPGAISTFNLIIMRASFQSIPESLIESAVIDGAEDFTILFKIVMPISKPILAVMVLYYAVGHWNDFFNPLLYLRDRDLYPIQLVLRDILISNSTDSMTTGVVSDSAYQVGENIKYATIIVSTLPILLIYPLIQKYFVQGVMVGAIKE